MYIIFKESGKELDGDGEDRVIKPPFDCEEHPPSTIGVRIEITTFKDKMCFSIHRY